MTFLYEMQQKREAYRFPSLLDSSPLDNAAAQHPFPFIKDGGLAHCNCPLGFLELHPDAAIRQGTASGWSLVGRPDADLGRDAGPQPGMAIQLGIPPQFPPEQGIVVPRV